MSDSILPKLLDKVAEARKVAEHPDSEKKDILAAIVKLENWLVGDRSLMEHRCLQAFFTFLYNSYGGDFSTREDFVDWVKYQIGYCKVKTTEATIQGERVTFRKFKPKSLSFADCSQKLHNTIFKKVQEFAAAKWQFPFKDWYKQWMEQPHTLQ